MKYDSKFEKEAHEIMQGCEYHPEQRLFYLVPKHYEPDFVYTHRGKTWYIEAKGRFRTSEEARKYVIIAETLSPKEELVFLFQRAKTPMPGSRRRKDGPRYTREEVSLIHI